MWHSMYKGTVFKEETAPRLTFLCSDLQCLPPCDPIILSDYQVSAITEKSFNRPMPYERIFEVHLRGRYVYTYH